MSYESNLGTLSSINIMFQIYDSDDILWLISTM